MDDLRDEIVRGATRGRVGYCSESGVYRDLKTGRYASRRDMEHVIIAQALGRDRVSR